MPKQASHSHSLDLFAIAHQSMIAADFLPDFSAAVMSEIDVLAKKPFDFSADKRDLRELLWSSIDDSS